MLHHEFSPEQPNGLFFNAGDIGAGNPQLLGHLPLGEGAHPAQAVAEGENLLFPAVQQGVDVPVELFRFELEVNDLQNVVVLGHDVQQRQGVAVLVGVNGVVDVHIPGRLLFAPEVHEYFICYAHATDFMGSHVEGQYPLDSKWRPYLRISRHSYLMGKKTADGMVYALLYVHPIRIAQAPTLVQSERNFLLHPECDELTTVADKLRWHRQKQGLKQKEVAELVGINRSTYINFEFNGRDFYPLDTLVKIADLYKLPVEDLMDDYTRFISEGQGEKIRSIRTALNMTQYEFGKLFGVSSSLVKKWENDTTRISKTTWANILEYAK